jgi:hypothetical protein
LYRIGHLGERHTVLPSGAELVFLEMGVFEAGVTERLEQQIRGRPALGTSRDAAADRVGETLKEGLGSAAGHRHSDDAVDAFVRALRQRGAWKKESGCERDDDSSTARKGPHGLGGAPAFNWRWYSASS